MRNGTINSTRPSIVQLATDKDAPRILAPHYKKDTDVLEQVQSMATKLANKFYEEQLKKMRLRK